MDGLEIVIKNQNGRIYPRMEDALFFDCPICGKNENVESDCIKTYSALVKIEKFPIVQLICVDCGEFIENLHSDDFSVNDYLDWKEIYTILDWE